MKRVADGNAYSTLSLVERELLNSLEWLISLRWFAGLAVLLATPLAAAVFKVQLPVASLIKIGLAILGYNVVLLLSLRYMRRTDPENTDRLERFARAQIALDWITLAALIALSGGAESPALIFFLFHIAIASLLLPHDLGMFYVSLAPLLVAGVAALEYTGVLPHVAIIQPARYHDPVFVGAALGFFVIACYGMAYCCMVIAHRLRRRNSELASLYDGVRDIASTIEIDTVLDRIVGATARVLHCRAAAIRLIDQVHSQVEFAASYGLSDSYQEEVPGELARSVLDQDTLRDGVVHVRDVEKDPRVWHAERVQSEGIASMLSAAILGRTGAIGVLRAYGAPGHRFASEDEAYLRAVAAQGAVAIEHAKAYRLLANLDIDKSRFLRMTTHELRSPVRVTESLLMTLADGYAGALDPDQGELVRRAQRRLASLHTLIDDLLNLAAGKVAMVASHQCVLDLRGVAAKVIERFLPVAAGKHILLELKSPGGPLNVLFDPADLERIVDNLVSNAVKYTPTGKVTVTLSGGPERIRLEVVDTGIGIPNEALQHLFSEFYRAPNAKAVEESGTGLGLSIVRQLVDRAGGVVTVASTEGEGSTFAIELACAGSTGVGSSPP